MLKVDSIRARNGISIVARNDDGANKRGTGFYVFETEVDRFGAERHLFPHTRASAEAIRLATMAASETREFVSPATAHEVASWDATPPSRRAVMTVYARCSAASVSYPRRAVDAAESIGDVVRAAIAYVPEFEPVEDIGPNVTGLLIGRSTHHLAVQTEDNGRGVILDRWKIALPLAQTDAGGREVSFDVRSVIGIEFDADGFGRALQIPRSRHADSDSSSTEDARDLTIGSLRIKAIFAARHAGVLPILHFPAMSAQCLPGDPHFPSPNAPSLTLDNHDRREAHVRNPCHRRGAVAGAPARMAVAPRVRWIDAMMNYRPDVVSEISSDAFIRLYEVLSGYDFSTAKKHTRKDYAVVCPMHHDEHASMSFDPAGRQWFCPVCHVGGGIADMVLEFKPNDFSPTGFKQKQRRASAFRWLRKKGFVSADAAEEDDPELDDYNAYLARLNQQVQGHGRWHGLR